MTFSNQTKACLLCLFIYSFIFREASVRQVSVCLSLDYWTLSKCSLLQRRGAPGETNQIAAEVYSDQWGYRKGEDALLQDWWRSTSKLWFNVIVDVGQRRDQPTWGSTIPLRDLRWLVTYLPILHASVWFTARFSGSTCCIHCCRQLFELILLVPQKHVFHEIVC